jgi:hypothetical protein
MRFLGSRRRSPWAQGGRDHMSSSARWRKWRIISIRETACGEQLPPLVEMSDASFRMMLREQSDNVPWNSPFRWFERVVLLATAWVSLVCQRSDVSRQSAANVAVVISNGRQSRIAPDWRDTATSKPGTIRGPPMSFDSRRPLTRIDPGSPAAFCSHDPGPDCRRTDRAGHAGPGALPAPSTQRRPAAGRIGGTGGAGWHPWRASTPSSHLLYRGA